LTGFQRDLLYVIAGLDKPAGRTVKKELEQRIGEITHGRLYPNLDTLVDAGFVRKGRHDRRTNFYQLTESGRQALQEREQWEAKYLSASEGKEVPQVDTERSNGEKSSA
jgi:DNA-binding PadR family transcriptional regulator